MKIKELSKEQKVKLTIALVIVVATIFLLIGGTYAYYVATLKKSGNEETKMSAATLVNVTMEYGGTINSEGILPGHKVVKTIHVKGEGVESSIPTSINLTLTPEVTDFTNHVRYTIYGVEKSTIEISNICGNAENQTSGGKYYDAMECDTSSLGTPLKTGIFVDKQVETLETTVKYNTDITYFVIVEYINDTEQDQNSEQGKTFTINLGYEGEEEKSYSDSTSNIMAYDATAFWQYEENITKVVFEPTIETKTSAKYTFDVSENQDGSVMSYLVTNPSDTSTYTLYLQSNGGVKANPNSSFLFGYFTNLVSIDGLEFLDTSNVTNMEEMFAGCTSLTSLDLSSFDTSSVTNMSGMFYNCTSLTSLDLSSFDTSSVISMSNMFYGCSSLNSLNTSSFNTSNVTMINGMFTYCSSLTNLDLSNFDTSNVRYIFSMFAGCTSLTSLDLSNFDTSQVTYEDSMFNNMPSSAKVYVKNTTEQQRFLSSSKRPSTWTEENVIVKA